MNELEFLINPSYQNIIKNVPNKVEKKKEFNNDRKFYKPRILNLMKNMLNKKESHPSLDKSFHIFVSDCIEHFKTIDKNEILQEEYKDISFNEMKIDCTDDSLISANDCLFKKSTKGTKIEDFIDIRKIKLKKEEKILPQAKNINLKENYMKTKGTKYSKNYNLSSKIDEKKD